ncbi:GAF domain-containing protein [Duganella sp. CF402]|uniref:ATP-binding protein n=1 Tax=unclassified Duganella TaxID=2636909 RepID=UPI0008BFDE74|nr:MULTISPECIES: ATP-binding protein [unclassified Duganella]RZT11494.1 GAF domain-containing protein [Duganella sp. BK701]SEK62244.1 GAF domain-containing protein [Duganella sp. CF402]
MDMFALDDALADWEAALPSSRGPARLPMLLPLAWHLRQRDTPRALQLTDEGLALLAGAALPTADAQAIATRFLLVRAEASWLAGQLELADEQAADAGERFASLHHPLGQADAHWLRAWIAIDQGRHEAAAAELDQMAAAARAAGDAQRSAIADAVNARWCVLHDLPAAQQRWGGRFTADDEAVPAVASWIYDYYGLAASQASDFGAAAAHYLRCYEAALETGQLRMAITAAINIGLDFTILNDHHAALEWMESALDLARPTGWPRSIGACLMHTADTMRRLGRLDATAELLHEALDILAPMSGARAYATALHYLGDLSLDKTDYTAALDAFRKLQERGVALQHADFQSIARRGQAHALCFLDRPQEALAMAEQAAQLAQEQANRYNHVAALRVMSLIHLRHQLPAPAGMTEPNATLHFLHQALAVAGHINGYTLPADLHDALAREYAHIGDYQKAYASAQLAAAAREKTHSQDATNRAIAMQVQHQTEHARAEGQHHRELAAAEARRVQLLQQTTATLERLSAIGQEITTHLDAGAVFQALDRHVQALLPANSLAVYLCDPGHDSISRVFGIENGQPLAANTIAIDNPRANAARSLRERAEIYVADAGPNDIFLAPGTQLMASALYVPLLVGERALGVMTVQCTLANAYGARERLIFRTLCAYGAIALDNAEAYRQLKDAQTQLVSQEKLAALGALMAGVAHELNTPIGNSLLIASTLVQKTEELEAQMNGAGLKRSALAAYLEDARKAHELVMRGLNSAANLVNSFKQVAVDRTTEQRREFNLSQVSMEVIATMMNRIRASNHRIEIEVPDTIALDSYPGPYGQVIANFINNALLHAFTSAGSGSMWLRAQAPVDGRVLVTFRDNGCGIAPEHMSRIFDPFFTTKLGQGGSGLGLSISYNIVTSLMGGQISVHSSREGTTFTLDLPLTAPEHQQPATAQIYN